MSEGRSVIHLFGMRDELKQQRPRRASLGDMITAATRAGLTVKKAVIVDGKIELEFGGPTQAAAPVGWEKAIEKAISKPRRVK
jgi:hypothetical protein